ncbi:MAG: type VI secretion system baseplate subunit TssF [Siculibacillus sp.]|nr:type VI secretion system baseplate subunit TssF [Siculibacillus sp.]
MDYEFLDFYNRELKLLREQAKEFAEEYPGIADRLGGLLEDRSDPMITGLLEGTAFLAARVQLKLKHEFPEFTSNLLEQLLPDFLAPTPSAILVRAEPKFGDPALLEGKRFSRGTCLDAVYLERDRRIACRYSLTADLWMWPFEITAAEYHPAPAQLHAAGLKIDGRDRAGLRIAVTTRASARADAEITHKEAMRRPETHAARVPIDTLDVHLCGPEGEAVALYEQIIGHRTRVVLRWLDANEDPRTIELPIGSVDQIGLGAGESLIPDDSRFFHGFALLRDYFIFARKFLGFRLTGLSRAMKSVTAKSFEVWLVFDEAVPRLSAAVNASSFALNAAPAVNLFEMTTDRLQIKRSQAEYHVVPDRSRPIDFEPHRLLDVFAHYGDSSEKVPVLPLYSAPRDPKQANSRLRYTVRRLSRRRTGQERRLGSASDYIGTEMFLSFLEPATLGDAAGVTELSIRALCSNRHLTETLPVGTGGADFHFLDDSDQPLACIAGPTPPRTPIGGHLRSRGETASAGSVTWRLINMLSFNQLGLVGHAAGRNAQALREILGLFADMKEASVERRIDGIRSVESRPIVRRIRRDGGTGAARGLEVTVTVDEKSFEGSGAFLLGAVLDRFFAEYVSVNNFTQTVIRSIDRGEIMRWPVRLGTRRPL